MAIPENSICDLSVRLRPKTEPEMLGLHKFLEPIGSFCDNRVLEMMEERTNWSRVTECPPWRPSRSLWWHHHTYRADR
jgi:hypothetical protein